MPTRAYFALIRRLVRAGDDAVVNSGGIVGKHLGDGITAFFLAQDIGSESAAARAAIEAMRGIERAARAAAERSGMETDEVVVRFGLHWGATREAQVGRVFRA